MDLVSFSYQEQALELQLKRFYNNNCNRVRLHIISNTLDLSSLQKKSKNYAYQNSKNVFFYDRIFIDLILKTLSKNFDKELLNFVFYGKLENFSLINTGSQRNCILAIMNDSFLCLDDDVDQNFILRNQNNYETNELFKINNFQSENELFKYIQKTDNFVTASIEEVFEFVEKCKNQNHLNQMILFGHFGDSGFSNWSALFNKPKPQLDKELGDGLFYTRNVESRTILRTLNHQITPSFPVIMMPAVAFNQGQFAPFIPLDRNQDGSYSYLQKSLYPQTQFIQSPFMFFHHKKNINGYNYSKYTARLTDIIVLISLEAFKNKISLIEELKNILVLNDSDLYKYIYCILDSALKSRMQHLQQLVNFYKNQHSHEPRSCTWQENTTVLINLANEESLRLSSYIQNLSTHINVINVRNFIHFSKEMILHWENILAEFKRIHRSYSV